LFNFFVYFILLDICREEDVSSVGDPSASQSTVIQWCFGGVRRETARWRLESELKPASDMTVYRLKCTLQLVVRLFWIVY